MGFSTLERISALMLSKLSRTGFTVYYCITKRLIVTFLSMLGPITQPSHYQKRVARELQHQYHCFACSNEDSAEIRNCDLQHRKLTHGVVYPPWEP